MAVAFLAGLLSFLSPCVLPLVPSYLSYVTGKYQAVGPFGYRGPPVAAVEKMQPLIRTGQRITVPEGSPIRTKLAILPVSEQEIQRNLVLPAVVEADPAHLIKVLPPLPGRVTQLMVQLGERVKANQPLVVIDAPDLATAYADYDRAKELLSFALKNRERQRILGKEGWTALKDLQQVETDYATATERRCKSGVGRGPAVVV